MNKESNTGKYFIHFRDSIPKSADLASGFTQDTGLTLISSNLLYSGKKRLINNYEAQFYDNLNIALATLDENQLENISKNIHIKAIYPEKRTKTIAIEADFAKKADNWGIKRLGTLNTVLVGQDVKIAVLDSGIDKNHPLLKHAIVASYNCIDPGETTTDYWGHGTHVAGIICSKPHDGLKIGVAPACKIYVGKVLNNVGNFQDDSWIIDGINWALDNNCQLINLSLGRPPNKNGIDPNFEKIITKARRRGCLVVAGVGNDSIRVSRIPKFKPIYAPANCSYALAVSAIDSKEALYPSANRSIADDQQIDFIAPGVSIFSTFPQYLNIRGFAHITGTSMATAYITGLLALYIGKFPKYSINEILGKFKNSTGISIRDIDRGHGVPSIME